VLATVQKIDGGYMARFERHLKHPVEKVWASLTQPEKLANWLADAVIDLKEGGKLELTFSKTEGNVVVSTITEVKPLSVLEFTWGDDLIRFELYPKQEGCLLVLKQTFHVLNEQTPKDLAGWHVHLDILLSSLEGELVEFSYSQWRELYDKYTKMPAQAKSVLKLKNWNEMPFSEIEGGPKLTKGSFVTVYQGELQGESVLEELKCYFTDAYATVYGLERITGRVGDKSGSFVLEHRGKFENGIHTSKRTVVPGSGTGDLKGIRGEIHFESGSAEEFPITFHYYFE
jgi:uncharacterized protein YndB with AHSA1/START domain